MLQEQVIPIDFGQGVDTKTDPKLVVAGKMLRLENAVFTNAKRIAKRNGYSALSSSIVGVGSLSAPAMVHGYKNELIAQDQGMLLTYSSTADKWLPRGNYTSTELQRTTVDQQNAASGYADSAIIGNYVLYGWGVRNGANSYAYASIIDLSTGAALYGPTRVSSAVSALSGAMIVKCVLLGGTTLAIAYVSPSAASVVLRTFTISSGAVSVSSEQTITSNFIGSADTYFDLVPTAAGGVVAYQCTTGIRVSSINTSGAIVATQTFTDADYKYPITLSQDSANGNVWLYFGYSTISGSNITASLIKYAVVDSSMNVVLAATTLKTLSGSPLFFPTNFSALKNSTTSQTLYYSYPVLVGKDSAGADVYIDATYSISGSISGTPGTATLFANGMIPISKPFAATSSGSSKNYAFFLYRGHSFTNSIQCTLFLVQLSTLGTPSTANMPLVVTRFASGTANTEAINGAYTQLPTSLISPRVVGYVSNVSAVSASKVLFTYGANIQNVSSDFVSANFSGISGTFAASIDFNGSNSYRAVNCSDLAVLNGGLIQTYDGNSCNELNFHLFPEITGLVQSSVPGNHIANGEYSYIAIFQWVDSQGNLHQSAPSEALSITTTGVNNTVTVYITSNYLSQKTGVSVAIYRTTNAGSIYYLVTDPFILTTIDPSSSAGITFEDGLADSDITDNLQAYSYPGSPVLENSAPPPSMIMSAHNNRLWFTNSEIPNEIWYSKSFIPGNGLSPSAFMIQEIDPKFGNIKALAEMDEKLIIFKESGIFIQSGDGVTDSGTGSTLSFPQLVPSDVGCSSLKSLVITPNGVMFQSPNGIYMINRSLGVGYVGLEVENYNSQTIVSANLIPGKSQIRFLCSSGLTLVYDYIFNQWSTFTNHTGTAATIWNSLYVYANSSGVILKEAPGVYTDNGTQFKLLAQTSWLALASVQGFQRVRRLAMLGDFTNGASGSHGMQIQAAYDFSTSFQSAVPYTFGAISASGTFQYSERLPQQKCDTISLLIQEVTTGSSLEYIDLSNMSFEAGVKRGLNNLPAAQSVG
jgi:hypothetical protein